MLAELLMTVPSADLTINETLPPVGALCGMVMLICITPGNPGACTAEADAGRQIIDYFVGL